MFLFLPGTRSRCQPLFQGNGGDIKYDGVRNGYGSLVLSGQDYELTGLFNGPDRSWT